VGIAGGGVQKESKVRDYSGGEKEFGRRRVTDRKVFHRRSSTTRQIFLVWGKKDVKRRRAQWSLLQRSIGKRKKGGSDSRERKSTVKDFLSGRGEAASKEKSRRKRPPIPNPTNLDRQCEHIAGNVRGQGRCTNFVKGEGPGKPKTNPLIY